MLKHILEFAPEGSTLEKQQHRHQRISSMNVQAQLAAAAKQRYKQINGIGETPPPPSATRKNKEPIVTGAHPSSTQAAKKAAAAAIAAKMGKSSPERLAPPVPRGPPPKKINSSRASALSSSLAKTTKISPAPASSSRAPGGPLTAEEEKIASQYRTMMKIGMPEGAVRHKMNMDGVDGQIVEAVISGGASQIASRNNAPKSSPTRSERGGGGGASSLSPEEEKIASQYRKMMKIGMPEGALRHKMKLDGVASKIQDSVIAGEVVSSLKSDTSGPTGGGRGASTLSPEEEKIASQYCKMIKIGMPEGAVRHKMNLDGVSLKIQDSVVSGGGALSTTSGALRGSASGGGPMSSLSPEEDKIASQYRKMMKIGMPEGAIRHKMNMDSISVKIQDSVVAGEVGASGSSPASTSSSSSSPGRCNGGNYSSLSSKEEQIASQYRRMMKVGMPEGAIRHKMNMDGISAKIQDSVVAGELPNPDAANYAEEEAPIRPANPMSAAIASSGGIGSLKKAAPIDMENREPVPGRSGNPLAAAIAAAGGQGSLKKASASSGHQNLQPEKPHSTNSIAAQLAASGFKNSLKKTQSKPPQDPPKPHSTNSMASEIAASGFQSSLRKTKLERMEPQATRVLDNSGFDANSEQRQLGAATSMPYSATKDAESLAPMNSWSTENFGGMLEERDVSPPIAPSRPPAAKERSQSIDDSEPILTQAPLPVVKLVQNSPKQLVSEVSATPLVPKQKIDTAVASAPQQKMDAVKTSLPLQKTDATPSSHKVPTSNSTIAAMVESQKAKAAATLAAAPALEESPQKQRNVNVDGNGFDRVTAAPEPPKVSQNKVEPEVSTNLAQIRGVGDKPNGTIVEMEKNGEIETATKVQNIKDLGNGQQEVVVATATVTTDGTTASGKRTRERKRKAGDAKDAKKVDDGVDHHCACIVM